jgi:hypothetical protein
VDIEERRNTVQSHAYRAAVAIAVVLTMTGCASRTALTQSLIDKYALTDGELKKVQYYLSDTFEIERVVTVQDSRRVTSGHSLRSEHGRVLESILFDNGLPGVAVEARAVLIRVAFEEGSSLTFERQSDGRFYIDVEGHIDLPEAPAAHISSMTDDIDGVETFDRTGLSSTRPEPLSGTIEYGGNEFGVRRGHRVYLTVKETSLSKLEKSRRRVEGMRLE